MASLFNALGRAFGTVSNLADMVSSGVDHLNTRMGRYNAEYLRDADDEDALNLARKRKDMQKDMNDITKEMSQLSTDPEYAKAQAWFVALKQELNGGPVAQFPGVKLGGNSPNNGNP